VATTADVARGILQDSYGIDLEVNRVGLRREEDIPFDPPAGY
jgi:hypothetical protein